MTCEEIRCCLEGHLRDTESLSDRAAVAEHISACVDCSRFLEEQRALASSLRALRESAGAVPESLDSAVLSRYRQFTMSRNGDIRMGRTDLTRFRPAWVWSAVAAAILMAASLWFSSSKQPVIKTEAPTPTSPVATVAKGATATLTHATGKDVARNVSAKEKKGHFVSRTLRSHPRSAPLQAAARASRSLPEGFRSLMYCDALSCPEDMEMIRIQLPSSALPGTVPGLVRTSGSVTADVLVGADGFARGIRFDEVEF